MTIETIDPRDDFNVFIKSLEIIAISQKYRMDDNLSTVEIHPDSVGRLIELLQKAEWEIGAKSGARKAEDREEQVKNVFIECVELLNESAAGAFRHGDFALESKCSKLSKFITEFVGLEALATMDDANRDLPFLPC